MSTISPMVRKFAREHGIPDEETVQLVGSGKNGSVTQADVLEWKARRAQADEPELEGPRDPIEEALADGDEDVMPVMDPDAEAAAAADIELRDEDGREDVGGNPWLEAVEGSRQAVEDARNTVVEEKVATRRVLSKVNPMRHKRWKPDKYRIAKKRPGWRCRFVHISNVGRYRSEGYSIATTRHYMWDGRNVGVQTTRGVEKTPIRVNNCVLMEIPEEVANARREYYRNMAHAALLSPTAKAVASGAVQRMGNFGKIKPRPGRPEVHPSKGAEGFF